MLSLIVWEASPSDTGRASGCVCCKVKNVPRLLLWLPQSSPDTSHRSCPAPWMESQESPKNLPSLTLLVLRSGQWGRRQATQSSAKLRESQSSPGQHGPEPEASVDTGQSDGIHTAFPLPTLLAWRGSQGEITRLTTLLKPGGVWGQRNSLSVTEQRRKWTFFLRLPLTYHVLLDKCCGWWEMGAWRWIKSSSLPFRNSV